MDWWAYENTLAADGWRLVCGVDEAGRGCLAGPVYAAAVILPFGTEIPGLNDSKLLTPAKREALYGVIADKAVTYAVASASETEVDELNILNATYVAMNRAIEKLLPQAELALIDGNRAKGINCLNKTIVDGDALCASIAAASILAKVKPRPVHAGPGLGISPVHVRAAQGLRHRPPLRNAPGPRPVRCPP